MEKMILKGTDTTPEIVMDPQNNRYEISGRCIPENPHKFFSEIINWIRQFTVSAEFNSMHLIIDVDYCNSGSSKMLVLFFDTIRGCSPSAGAIKVSWKCEPEDLDLKDQILEYAEITELDIQITDK